jgi:hypothetical protein
LAAEGVAGAVMVAAGDSAAAVTVVTAMVGVGVAM